MLGVAQDFDDDGLLGVEAEVVVHEPAETRGRAEYRNVRLATVWRLHSVRVAGDGSVYDLRGNPLALTEAERSTINKRPPIFGGERA